ncbi:MAG: hypothetical protein WCR54_01080 [Clostridia bacterium]
MKIYDGIINVTNELLSKQSAKNLPVTYKENWKTSKSNEFILSRDASYELGVREFPSAAFLCPTSNENLVNKDELLLYGQDLTEIKENIAFSRITYLRIKDQPDMSQNTIYKNIKALEFAHYRLNLNGYMLTASSMLNKEQVRISKDAIKNGINFETIGNYYINAYKKNPMVKNVKIMFITGTLPISDELITAGARVADITNSFDHALKNVTLDCDSCSLKPICDEVEGMRQTHFDLVNNKN